MRIVLDVMGGDLPPHELVAGGVAAARRRKFDLVLAGSQDVIQEALKAQNAKPGVPYEILPCSQVVGMDDAPVRSVREKRDSSLVRGLQYVKDGQADAFVSPGNTGAIVAGALLTLGRIPGIPRPGLLATLPTLTGKDIYVLDVGATSDCTPQQLLSFAQMGTTYVQETLGISEPTTALLNIGAERGKGNRLISEAYTLLESDGLAFRGNVEAHHVLIDRPADVIVCDGFVGNIFLKSIEGGVTAVTALLKDSIRGRTLAMLGALLMKGTFARVRRTLSYQQRGGAPLLGVNGTVVIGHGRSDAKAIQSAIDVACREVSARLTDKFREGVALKGQLDGG